MNYLIDNWRELLVFFIGGLLIATLIYFGEIKCDTIPALQTICNQEKLDQIEIKILKDHTDRLYSEYKDLDYMVSVIGEAQREQSGVKR